MVRCVLRTLVQGSWFKVTSTVNDGQGYLVASVDGLADALVERIEGLLGVKQGVEAVVLAYEDAAVEAVVDAVVRFDLRAITR